MTQDNLYQALYTHIINSTNELQRELLQALDAVATEENARSESSAGNSLAFDDVIAGTLQTTINGTPRAFNPRRAVSLETLGRSVLNKVGRNLGTQLGSAVTSALFGSTTTNSQLSSQQLRNDIIKSIFK
jgi:hypothetical protein